MCLTMACTQVLVPGVEELERHFSKSPEKLVLTSLAELSTKKGRMYLRPSSEARNSSSQAEAGALCVMIEWMASIQSVRYDLRNKRRMQMRFLVIQ